MNSVFWIGNYQATHVLILDAVQGNWTLAASRFFGHVVGVDTHHQRLRSAIIIRDTLDVRNVIFRSHFNAPSSRRLARLYSALQRVAVHPQPGRDDTAFDRFPEAHRATRRLIQRDRHLSVFSLQRDPLSSAALCKEVSLCLCMVLSIDSCGRDRFSNRHMATFELLQQFRSFKGSASIPCGRAGTRRHKTRCFRYSRTKLFACRFFERWCCRDDDRPVGSSTFKQANAHAPLTCRDTWFDASQTYQWSITRALESSHGCPKSGQQSIESIGVLPTGFTRSVLPVPTAMATGSRPPIIWLRGSTTATVTVDTVRSAALTVREYLTSLPGEVEIGITPCDRPLRAANVFVRRTHRRRARLCCSGMCRRRLGESRRSPRCLAAWLVFRRHEWWCAFVHHPRICDFGAGASRAEKSRLHFKRRAQAGAQRAGRPGCRRGNRHPWFRRVFPGGVS